MVTVGGLPSQSNDRWVSFSLITCERHTVRESYTSVRPLPLTVHLVVHNTDSGRVPYTLESLSVGSTIKDRLFHFSTKYKDIGWRTKSSVILVMSPPNLGTKDLYCTDETRGRFKDSTERVGRWTTIRLREDIPVGCLHGFYGLYCTLNGRTESWVTD